jgi:hypothetical protein
MDRYAMKPNYNHGSLRDEAEGNKLRIAKVEKAAELAAFFSLMLELNECERLEAYWQKTRVGLLLEKFPQLEPGLVKL